MKKIKICLILVLLLTFSMYWISVSSAAQNPNVVQNPDNGNLYELVFVLEGIDWFSARDAAEAQSFGSSNGHLATITSQEENDFILNNIESLIPKPCSDNDVPCDIWIGGTRDTSQPPSPLAWEWVTGEPFTYANWAEGEPDEPGVEDCIYFQGDGFWDDEDCLDTNDVFYYLIEYEEVSNPIPTMNEWGMIITVVGLGLIGLFVIRGKRHLQPVK